MTATLPLRVPRPGDTRPPGHPAARSRTAAHRRTVQGLAASFAQLFLEVECGRRTAAQLAPLLDPVLFARLADVWVRPGPIPEVLTVLCAPGAGCCVEAVAIVRRGRRTAALAFRLRPSPQGWRVDALARPEDGPLPPPAWDPLPPPDDGEAERPDQPEEADEGWPSGQ